MAVLYVAKGNKVWFWSKALVIICTKSEIGLKTRFRQTCFIYGPGQG